MRTLFPALMMIVLSAAAAPAWAYVGPGAGLTAIGTLVALVGAVLLAIVGFLWYPIKKLMKKKQPEQPVAETVAAAPRVTDGEASRPDPKSAE